MFQQCAITHEISITIRIRVFSPAVRNASSIENDVFSKWRRALLCRCRRRIDDGLLRCVCERANGLVYFLANVPCVRVTMRVCMSVHIWQTRHDAVTTSTATTNTNAAQSAT